MRNKIIFGVIIVASLLLYLRVAMLMAQANNYLKTSKEQTEKIQQILTGMPAEANPDLVMALEHFSNAQEAVVSVMRGEVGEFYYFFVLLSAGVLFFIVLVVLFFKFVKNQSKAA